MAREHRERATGIIKKVFTRKPDHFGFMKLLTPIESRGEEAVFSFKDMLLEPFEKTALQPGMLMQFYIKEKPENFLQSSVPFRATEIRPVDPAEHAASVISGAGSETTGKQLLVCLELTLTRVLITPDSYRALKLQTPLQTGDRCIVRIAWREMVDASLTSRLPNGEIVAVSSPPSNLSRQRSISSEHLSRTSSPRSSNETSESTTDIASEEETSSDLGRELDGRRSRGLDTVPMRRRCQSAGEYPNYDASMLPPGRGCSYQSPGQMNPYPPMNPFLHPDESQYYSAINSAQYDIQTDPSQCHNPMSQTQAHPAYNAAPCQCSGTNSAQWLPTSGPSSRQASRMRMSLMEYIARGGKIF